MVKQLIGPRVFFLLQMCAVDFFFRHPELSGLFLSLSVAPDSEATVSTSGRNTQSYTITVLKFNFEVFVFCLSFSMLCCFYSTACISLL